MIQTITYDQQAALSSEEPQRISESGAYVGVFDQADMYDTPNGATMARFRFTCTATGSVAWLSLCLRTGSGDTPFTFGIFQSLMSVLDLMQVMPKPGKIKRPNGQTDDGYRMKELERKPVGLVLQAEPREYQAKDGSIKIATDMTIRRPFRASDRRTAKEIVTNAEPTRVAADVQYLKDHPKAVRTLDGSVYQPQQQAQPQAATYVADARSAGAQPVTEDDCPF